MGMVQDNVADTCSLYYDRFRRQAHVTPKSYLSFLDGYKVLYKDKHVTIAEMAKRSNIVFYILSLSVILFCGSLFKKWFR